MEWIDQDELVEVTPDMIRARKKIIECNRRPKRNAGDQRFGTRPRARAPARFVQ